MTKADLADLRRRLYEAYASQHVSCGGAKAAALVHRRDIWALLPPTAARPVVDLGCGRGELVQLHQADGFDAAGIYQSGAGGTRRRSTGGPGPPGGLVLLEAQAAGTPVIAPAYGGSHEAYIEGVTGVAPADESAEALTRTLDDLLKDPARLAWMGGHAVQWTRRAFDPESYAQLTARRLL